MSIHIISLLRGLESGSASSFLFFSPLLYIRRSFQPHYRNNFRFFASRSWSWHLLTLCRMIVYLHKIHHRSTNHIPLSPNSIRPRIGNCRTAPSTPIVVGSCVIRNNSHSWGFFDAPTRPFISSKPETYSCRPHSPSPHKILCNKILSCETKGI